MLGYRFVARGLGMVEVSSGGHEDFSHSEGSVHSKWYGFLLAERQSPAVCLRCSQS